MAEHILDRRFEAARGTFGRLTSARGTQWDSMEREWLDNRQFVSCVPPGRYLLEPWSSKKWPHTRCLVGGVVGMVPGPGILRSAVLVHPANDPLQLKGCLALGVLAGGSRLAGRSSKPAVLAFLAELDSTDEPHWLTIKGVPR